MNKAECCPKCGAAMHGGTLEGLCPACLLAQGYHTETKATDGKAQFTPPSLEQLADLFPQLELVQLLGAGGMGAVYKARQPALDRFVALKVLPTRGEGGSNFEERFNREARALARLSHPNIVAVHEFGKAGALHYFIMEYVDGANLRQLQNTQRLSPHQALAIVPQICDALQYAHDQGVVHRDIKPENVLVDRRGRVKIADFGLAKILGADAQLHRLTAEGQVMGTPHYMAPEQIERPLSVDHRADIYSLGVVFYELLTGELPIGRFAPPSSRQAGLQLDVRLDEIVLRALENDPERRYQHASEVKERLGKVNEGPAVPQASGSEPEAPNEKYVRWAGIPVVVERNGEREVSFNGALSAVAATAACAAVGFLLVRWISGTEHVSTRLGIMASLFAAGWGIRRAMNREEPAMPQTSRGTVILNRRVNGQWFGDMATFAALLFFLIGSQFFFLKVVKRGQFPKPGEIAVQQTAAKGSNGTMVVDLPGQGRIEVVAITKASSEPWFTPTGNPKPDVNYRAEGLGNYNPEPGLIPITVMVRETDLPTGADGLYFSFEPGIPYQSVNKVQENGKQMPGGWAVRAGVREQQSKLTLRVGVALEPWTILGTHKTGSQSFAEVRNPKSRWRATFHQISEAGGSAQVTLVHGPDEVNWKTQLLAVDTEGVAHTPVTASGTPAGTLQTWTYTFSNLPLASVREFQVQTRPVHWVEFRQIRIPAETHE